jgi:hypothetical protein
MERRLGVWDGTQGGVKAGLVKGSTEPELAAELGIPVFVQCWRVEALSRSENDGDGSDDEPR